MKGYIIFNAVCSLIAIIAILVYLFDAGKDYTETKENSEDMPSEPGQEDTFTK